MHKLRALIMQRDMKIGMALGVALIGIVGALFFRREPEVSNDKTPPPVENVDRLDEEIAENGRAPYNQKIDAGDEASAPVPSASNTGRSVSNKKSGKVNGKKDGKSRDLTDDNPGALGGLGADESLAEDIPAHNADWTPTGPAATTSTRSGQAPRGSNTASATGRTHVIQTGDTLSGLAARYLGSPNRYLEIYEANRPQLRSPNDVREGMTLKIPDVGKARDDRHAVDAETDDLGPATTSIPTNVTRTKSNSKPKVQSATRKQTVPVQNEDEMTIDGSSDEIAPSTKPLFVPVRGGPFAAGRNR
jgi:LysM repeat protein